MSLSADCDTREVLKTDASFSFPVAAATQIFAGAMVATDTSGNAVPASASLTQKVWGRAESMVDNRAGIAGAKTVQVKPGLFTLKNGAGGDALAASDVGQLCYVSDDTTVNKTTGGGTRPPAGKFWGLRGAKAIVELGEPSLWDADPSSDAAVTAEAVARAAADAALAATVAAEAVARAAADAKIGSVYVYAPGGVASGNTFTTFLAAYTAAFASGTFCDLVIDDSAAPGTAVSGAAGVLDLTKINLVGGLYGKSYSQVPFTFQTGTTVATGCWRAIYNLEVHSTSNAAICVVTGTAANSAGVQQLVLNYSTIIAGTAANFFHLVDVDGNTELDFYLFNYSSLRDGASFRVAQSDANTYATATFLSASGFSGSPFGGAGHCDFYVGADARPSLGTIPIAQANVSGPFTVTPFSVAGLVTYSPNPAGNWAAAAPTTVAQALDRMATKVKALNGGTAIP